MKNLCKTIRHTLQDEKFFRFGLNDEDILNLTSVIDNRTFACIEAIRVQMVDGHDEPEAGYFILSV